MTELPSTHVHDFTPTRVMLRRGPVDGGRCTCGLEVVGPETAAPFRVNAGVIRACQDFNDAMVAGLVELADRLKR